MGTNNLVPFKFLLFFCCVVACLLAQPGNAQKVTEAKSDTSVVKRNRDTIPQEDAIDFFLRVTKLKISHKPDSQVVKPGKILTAVFPAAGYSFISAVEAVVAANFSFYTGNIKVNNLSTVSFTPQVTAYDQLILPVISNIWLYKNEINLLGDYRFYRYPSYTFGLGGSNFITERDQIDYSYVKISQEALKRIADHLFGGIGYASDYHFFIEDLSDHTDFEQYNNNATSTTSAGIIVHLKYDTRKNINNPKNEFFGSIIYRNNFTWLGSTSNWQSLQFDFRKYIKLGSDPDKVLAFWSWDVFTFGGNVPYLDLPSTGWDIYAHSGRGYIQGRYRGTDLLYFESEYRFGITRNGLLGGVIFANAESVPEWPSGQFKSVYPAEGFGLRIKFNRYSDTNLCIDYGFGTEGSQGIFFNLGEVF